jgi:hypothetical protein
VNRKNKKNSSHSSVRRARASVAEAFKEMCEIDAAKEFKVRGFTQEERDVLTRTENSLKQPQELLSGGSSLATRSPSAEVQSGSRKTTT